MPTIEYELNLDIKGFYFVDKSTGKEVNGRTPLIPGAKKPSNLDLYMPREKTTTFRITLGESMSNWQFDTEQPGTQDYDLPSDNAAGKSKRTFCVNTSDSTMLRNPKFNDPDTIEFTCDKAFALDSNAAYDIHLLNTRDTNFSTKIIIDPVIRNQT